MENGLKTWEALEKPFKIMVFILKDLSKIYDDYIPYEYFSHSVLKNTEENYNGDGRSINKYLPSAKNWALLREDDYVQGTVRSVYLGSKTKNMIEKIPDVIDLWATENKIIL